MKVLQVKRNKEMIDNEEKKFNDQHKIQKFILSLCVADSDIKPEFTKPFTKDGILYATNSFIGVRYDNKELLNEYEEIKGMDNIETVWNTEDTSGDIVAMKVTDILLLAAEKERRQKVIVVSKENCSSCGGSGDCFCHCDHEHDCGECDGQGTQEKSILSNLKVTFAENYYLLKEDDDYGRINMDYLYLVGLAALALGESEINIQCIPDDRKFFIEMKGFKFLVMGMRK